MERRSSKYRGQIPNPSFDKLRMRSVEMRPCIGPSFIPQGRPRPVLTQDEGSDQRDHPDPSKSRNYTTAALMVRQAHHEGYYLQPALAAAIALHVAERPAAFAGDAEVEFAHILVIAQRARRAVEHDAPAFQDITEFGIA